MAAEKKRYLLILSCSGRKDEVPALLPALARYDGVNYRVVKKAMREGRWPPSIELLILSAKFGLIEPDKVIETYDVKMTPARARDLQEAVAECLDRRLEERDYEEVFVNAGKNYVLALTGSSLFGSCSGRVRISPGGWVSRCGG